MTIRPADPQEAPLLSELALRSKAYWGYDPQFLEACRDELAVTQKSFATLEVYVIELAGCVVAFYTLGRHGADGELYHFFVAPELIGHGLGKSLWDHAVCRARALDYPKLFVESDPYAEEFYRKMGAKRIGEVQSPVGRELPLLLFELPIKR